MSSIYLKKKYRKIQKKIILKSFQRLMGSADPINLYVPSSLRMDDRVSRLSTVGLLLGYDISPLLHETTTLPASVWII